MRKISNIFVLLAVILSDVMCAVVAYNFGVMQWGVYSAPASIAFLYAIPYVIGIVICLIIAAVFRKD